MTPLPGNLTQGSLKRRLRLLQHANHASALAAVDDRLGALGDRPGKFLHDAAQCLAIKDARGRYIADSIARHEALRFGTKIDAAVVDLDALLKVEIIPYYHLFAPAHGHPPH